MSRIVHVTTHPSQGSDDYDGTPDRPVLTYGRALTIAKADDAIAVDGVIGPPPTRANGWNVAALIAAALLAIYIAAALIGVLWHHPVGGALVCGSFAIVGYIAYCRRHGISL